MTTLHDKSGPAPKIEQLYFYPVKSFRGLSVDILPLDEHGPRYDRQWMLVDELGKFVTQRQFPQLARVALKLQNDRLELSTDELGAVTFLVDEFEGEELDVVVWGTAVKAFEANRNVSEWCSEFANTKLRLVRLSAKAVRMSSAKDFPRPLRFVDGQPLLVTDLNALHELELKVGQQISMARFRPNIVLSGTPAHAEDQWKGFCVDDVEFKATAPCVRCRIITVDQRTGETGLEPLKTLATYRRQELGIAFGYYYAHLSKGEIKIGASVYPR